MSGEEKISHDAVARRKLLVGLAGVGAAGVAATAGGIALQHHNATFHNPTIAHSTQIGHLLRRAGFGATVDELVTYSSPGYNGAVDRLLNYQQVSDDALEKRLQALNLDLNQPEDQQRWWLLRMAWTQRPLLEKMTLFWHGHFVSSYRKVGGLRAYKRMITQNQFLRDHAFDTFDNLLLGITTDAAMLFYLDLTQSTKQAPNENYAREMMELFSLGVGHYTQQDVTAGAAALTGWHVVGASSAAQFNPQDHDNQSKTYLGHTGNLDAKAIVHILTNHPATPWFLCRKLFTFFAYENPGDDDLKPLVAAYQESNHNMGAVMRALLHSPQFLSAKAYRSRLKSPIEFVIGAYRSLNVQSDGKELPAQATLMGQTVFDPPDVSGWSGDKISSNWLNSGTWMTRLNYIDMILSGTSTNTTNATSISNRVNTTNTARPNAALDIQAIVDTNAIDSPEHFVEYFAAFLLDGQLDQSRKEQLIGYFTAGGAAVSSKRITLTNGVSYPLYRVRGTVYLLLSSPEYQFN